MDDNAEIDREIETEDMMQDAARAAERAEQFVRDARALIAFMDHTADSPRSPQVRAESQRRLAALKAI